MARRRETEIATQMMQILHLTQITPHRASARPIPKLVENQRLERFTFVEDGNPDYAPHTRAASMKEGLLSCHLFVNERGPYCPLF